MTNDDPTLARDAHIRRLIQVKAMMELFRRANGRDAEDTEELGQWFSEQTDFDSPINPNILGDKWMAQAMIEVELEEELPSQLKH
jgi:hypothetical protein